MNDRPVVLEEYYGIHGFPCPAVLDAVCEDAVLRREESAYFPFPDLLTSEVPKAGHLHMLGNGMHLKTLAAFFAWSLGVEPLVGTGAETRLPSQRMADFAPDAENSVGNSGVAHGSIPFTHPSSPGDPP